MADDQNRGSLWLTVGGIYLALFVVYHVLMPLVTNTWILYKPFDFDSGETECQLHVQYPPYIPLKIAWMSPPDTTPFIFRLTCNDAIVVNKECSTRSEDSVSSADTDCKNTLQFTIQPSPPASTSLTFFDQDGNVLPQVISLTAGETWESAPPETVWIATLSRVDTALSDDITLEFQPLGLKNQKDDKGQQDDMKLLVHRLSVNAQLAWSLLDFLFNQYLFAIFGGLVGVYEFWKKSEDERKERTNAALATINGWLDEAKANALTEETVQAMLAWWDSQRDFLLSDQGVSERYKKLVDALRRNAKWQSVVAGMLLAKSDRDKLSLIKRLTEMELLQNDEADGLRVVLGLENVGDLSAATKKITRAINFLGLEAVGKIYDGLSVNIKENVPSIILQFHTIQRGKKSPRKELKLLPFPREWDYWFEPFNVVLPTPLDNNIFKPIRAEEDPRLRKGLFYPDIPEKEKVFANAGAHWFVVPPGGGTSAMIRMGQHKHRPWGTNRFGFSLYIYWDGNAEAESFKWLLEKAFFRSLQRALTEDPRWFYLTPQSLQKEIVAFLDELNPGQTFWQAKLDTERLDNKVAEIAPIEIAYLNNYLNKLRSGTHKKESPRCKEDIFPLLREVFAALASYHRRLWGESIAYDEKPWLWIEVPEDRAPDSGAWQQKIDFLQKAEDVWSHTCPKIFLTKQPENLLESEKIVKIQWVEKDLDKLLMRRFKNLGLLGNNHLWEVNLKEQLSDEQRQTIFSMEISDESKDISVKEIAEQFCKYLAKQGQTPREVLAFAQTQFGIIFEEYKP